MTNPLQSDQAYELFIYTLAEHFPAIHRSTLTFVRRGGGLARIAGELHFAHTFRIVVRERLVYQRYPVVMDWYGYEVWQGDEKLYWYDPQPHPHEPTLQSTHPHHKHVPPDIKHNRAPRGSRSPRHEFHRAKFTETNSRSRRINRAITQFENAKLM